MIVFRCLGSGWRLELRSARERGRCRKRDERGKQNKKTWSLGQKSPHSFQIRHLDQEKKLRRRLSTQKGCKLSSLPRWLLGPSEKKRVTAPMLSPREKRSPGAPARTRRATKAVSSRRQLRGLPLRAATSTNHDLVKLSRPPVSFLFALFLNQLYINLILLVPRQVGIYIIRTRFLPQDNPAAQLTGERGEEEVSSFFRGRPRGG